MEATSHVFVDPHGLHSGMNGASFPVFSGGGANRSNNDGSSSARSASHQLLFDGGSGAGFLGPRPPLFASGPTSTHSSPSSWHVPQPPLLPVPLSKSVSLPSPSPPTLNRRAASPAAGRAAGKDARAKKSHPAKIQKDSRWGGGLSRKDSDGASAPMDVPKRSASSKYVMPEENDDFAGYVYSLSPPPSSLPMPKFSLRMRIDSRTTGGDGAAANGGDDAGLSDDLRRLLRL